MRVHIDEPNSDFIQNLKYFFSGGVTIGQYGMYCI